MHVDAFIDDYGTDSQASWFLMLHRLPAAMKMKFEKQIKKYKLRCKFEGEKWHIIGASRMGDVWLSKSGEFPYEKRIDIADCSEFSLWEDA
jgi:hypothetical protein